MLSKTSLTFPSTKYGVKSAALTFTLTNKGNTALTLTGTGMGITVGGTDPTSFAQTNNCGSSLAAGKVCTISVTFKPVATGTLTGTVRFGDNAAAGSPQKVLLTGTGDGALVSLSHTSLTFAATKVGAASAAQTVTLANKGNVALTLTGTGLGITVGGTDPTSFTQTNNCGTSLAGGKACTITVTFKPKATGALTANLRFGDNNAAGSPQKIPMTGTGQ